MNPIYGDYLITHKNSPPNQIPEYPREAVQKAKQEVVDLLNDVKEEKKEMQKNRNDVYLNGKIAAKFDTIHRIKRFLMIAHDVRCNKIEEQFWRFGGQVKKSQLPKLSTKQKEYLIKYKNIVNEYIRDVDLELIMDIEPSIDSVVEIRVLHDCGQIMGFGGQMIKLQKNSVHLINKKSVEKLIQKGDVVILK